VSSALVGSEFSVAPRNLTVMGGSSEAFQVTALIPSSATAGSTVSGSLALFTNDPANANRIFPIAATPTGATLIGTTQLTFVSSEVGTPAPPVNFAVSNNGNGPGTFAFGNPSGSQITLAGVPDGGVMLAAGNSFTGTASFTPTSTAPVSATTSITATGGTCGMSLSSITFTGKGTTGAVTGWPSSGTLDFGPVNCGGVAPSPQTIKLTNTGAVDARITSVDTSTIGGFTTDATVGSLIAANGGTLVITVGAPAVPFPSSLGTVSASFAVQTDADSSPTTIALTEEPQGAVLAFDTSATTNFGSFGSEILLQSSPPQTFNVTNAGTLPANVTLSALENGGADAGVADG
jgi:hypothetical protein